MTRATAVGLSGSRRYRAALAVVVAAAATPYGYTVSIWSAGAILMGAHGVPNEGQVAGFIGGALGGFALLGLASRPHLTRESLPDRAGDRVTAGTLHWIAISAAVGGVVLIRPLPGWAAWPLGSFAATTTYLLMAGLQLTVVGARRGGSPAAADRARAESRRPLRAMPAEARMGLPPQGGPMGIRKRRETAAPPPAPEPARPPWEKHLDYEERPSREDLNADRNPFADTLLSPVPLPRWLRGKRRQRDKLS